ncbi:MAG TPA: cation:proton antiporter [Vicinamibacteria bacterium]|nr:cation:proton antiporter [Vicinamibacteria bacterium]
MNEILSVGLILMAALVAGHAAQLVRVPEVTGYLLVGVAIGPAMLDLISHDDLKTLGFLSEVALGLILFGIGAIFEASNFRSVGRGVVAITAGESLTAFALVSVALSVLGLPVPVALLLGVIAMETAPATTLMVLHEYDARGPMTDRLLALIALNNMFVLVAYGLVSAGLTLATTTGEGMLAAGYRALFGLVWSTVGAVALGILLGLAVDAWAARTRESGEGMILAMGTVLIAVGAARWLGLSPLFATLALGATVANASRHGDFLMKALGRVDPPLYAAFFVLAGAELRPSSLLTVGVAGAAYVTLRAAGKLAGARFAMRRQDMPDVVRRHLGLCLLSSSSLAIGLTIQVRASFPEYAPAVTGVALAGVLVFEVVGPLLTRRALILSGEAQTRPSPLEEVPEPSLTP